MSNTEVKGKKVQVNQPAEKVFAAFSDLSRLTHNLPEEHRDKVTATPDTLVIQAQGMELGIQAAERVPYSLLRFEPYGSQKLFPFTFWVYVESIDEGNAHLQLELHAELSMMIKMMVGSKLQDGIDKLTEQFAAGLNGQTGNESA
jgi:carbon monoxide dehydrogenase subunit G